MLILGIETSCDETAVALVEDGRRVIANVVASQVRLHERFGGVVPELASRAHIQRLLPMIEAVLSDNGVSFKEVDALAVTQGPGLVGALIVGVETAKTLAWSFGKPLIPVHHIAAHLYAPFLTADANSYRLIVLDPHENAEGEQSNESASSLDNLAMAREENDNGAPLHFPHIGLVVSGGHSSLVVVHSPVRYEVIGETVDDAAGEAFDKLAKMLELGYPGGPVVEQRAKHGDRSRFALPRPMLNSPNFDLSFSGLKTAASKLVKELGEAEKIGADPQLLADVCASFQEAVVEVLLKKAGFALDKISQVSRRELAVVGGVACNGRLRSGVADYLPGVRAVFPPPVLCTDNAAMVAGLAYHLRDRYMAADLTLNATAQMSLPA